MFWWRLLLLVLSVAIELLWWYRAGSGRVGFGSRRGGVGGLLLLGRGGLLRRSRGPASG